MKKDFQEVFFHEFHGVEARFRDHDFYLSEEDVGAIKEYITTVVENAKETKEVDAATFQTVTRVIEVLEKSPEDTGVTLLEWIYYTIAQIDLMKI